MQLPEGTSYIPSIPEIAIALAIPAAACLLYFLFIENLAVQQKDLPEQPSPYAKSQFDQNLVCTKDSFRHVVIWRSALAVPLVAITIAILPSTIVTNRLQPREAIEAARGWEKLSINGDRDGSEVAFPHQVHLEQLQEVVAIDNDVPACLTCHFQSHPDWQEKIAAGETDCAECHSSHLERAQALETGESVVCVTCHHLSIPDDNATPCWRCHQDMDLPNSIFNHLLHQDELGGNDSCAECHVGERLAATAKPCRECHETMMTTAEKSLVMFEELDEDEFDDRFEYMAEHKQKIADAEKSPFGHLSPGYITAMHDRCVPCHEHRAEMEDKPEFGQCEICHKLDETIEIAQTP